MTSHHHNTVPTMNDYDDDFDARSNNYRVASVIADSILTGEDEESFHATLWRTPPAPARRRVTSGSASSGNSNDDNSSSGKSISRGLFRNFSWDGRGRNAVVTPDREEQQHLSGELLVQPDVVELQNLVSSLKERAEEAEQKLARYEKLDISSKEDLQLQIDSLKEQKVELAARLADCNKELTQLRLESLVDDGRREAGSTMVHISADDWRKLHSERDTALMQAGELAHSFAQARAQLDELQEELKQAHAQMEQRDFKLSMKQKEIAKLTSRLEKLQELAPKRSFFRASAATTTNAENIPNIDGAAALATIEEMSRKMERLEEEKRNYQTTVQELEKQLLGGGVGSRD